MTLPMDSISSADHRTNSGPVVAGCAECTDVSVIQVCNTLFNYPKTLYGELRHLMVSETAVSEGYFSHRGDLLT